MTFLGNWQASWKNKSEFPQRIDCFAIQSWPSTNSKGSKYIWIKGPSTLACKYAFSLLTELHTPVYRCVWSAYVNLISAVYTCLSSFSCDISPGKLPSLVPHSSDEGTEVERARLLEGLTQGHAASQPSWLSFQCCFEYVLTSTELTGGTCQHPSWDGMHVHRSQSCWGWRVKGTCV